MVALALGKKKSKVNSQKTRTQSAEDEEVPSIPAEDEEVPSIPAEEEDTPSTDKMSSPPPENGAQEHATAMVNIRKVSLPDTLGDMEKKVAQAVIVILMIEIILLIFGGAWTIINLFVPSKGESAFPASLETRLFITGLIVFLFFFLLLCLMLLYLHGRNAVLKAIYGKTPIPKEFLFSRIPKYVTWGELLSIIVILAGVVFAIADVIASVTSFNGGTFMLVDILFLAFTILLIPMIFLWQNGYNFIMGVIIQRNERVRVNPLSGQKSQVLYAFYGVILLGLALLAFGIIWTIVDAIYGPALALVFVATGVGFKIIFVGAIAAAEFAALIGVMMIFKWIYLKISQGLYLQVVPEGRKPKLPTKIIVAGVIVGVYIMAFAGILAVLGAIIQASPLQTLPVGPLFIAIGVLILLFSVLTLVGIFLFHNGFHLISEKVTESMEEMDVEMTKVEEEQEPLRQ
jgi:hypothetical protein